MLDEIPQPTETIEFTRWLPALTLADLHFRRDIILNFFIDQACTLPQAGVKGWITADCNMVWTALADDPLARKSLDIAGLNSYQPSAERPKFWKNLAWHLDTHRSVYGRRHFLVTETRIGVAGDTKQYDPFRTRNQWRMCMFQPLAYGASSLILWSGNRWCGGHWPEWGGVLDWSGKPEPDFS